MHCTEMKQTLKKGFTLTEVMMAISISSLLMSSLAGNILMHGRSYRYNQTSNENIWNSSLTLQRIVYGTGDYWGLRKAGQSGISVQSTGITVNGVSGWETTYESPMPGDDPQVLRYDPQAQTLELNQQRIASNVVDAYFTVDGSSVSIGIQAEHPSRGVQSMVETRLTLRNR
jgi:prepilin-type N-terminal cleavage/methylation domain-containing protein